MKYRSNSLLLAVMAALFVAAFSLSAPAGEVGSLNAFQPGDVADANDVNANFSALRSAVNDNDDRLSDLERSPSRRSVQIPGNSLGSVPGFDDVQPDFLGVRVNSSGVNSTRVFLRRPPDYAGGSAQLRVVFKPTSNTAGVVDFVISHSGNDLNGGSFEHVDLNAPGVTVGDQEQSHSQTFVVPADKLDFDMWSAIFRRAGSESTYDDPIIILTVDWEYDAL